MTQDPNPATGEPTYMNPTQLAVWRYARMLMTTTAHSAETAAGTEGMAQPRIDLAEATAQEAGDVFVQVTQLFDSRLWQNGDSVTDFRLVHESNQTVAVQGPNGLNLMEVWFEFDDAGRLRALVYEGDYEGETGNGEFKVGLYPTPENPVGSGNGGIITESGYVDFGDRINRHFFSKVSPGHSTPELPDGLIPPITD